MLKNAIFKYRLTLLLIVFAGITFYISNFSNASFVERNFRNGFFRLVRNTYDYSIGNLGIPFMYVLLPLLIVLLIYLIRSRLARFGLKLGILSLLRFGLHAVLLTYITFYFLWAFNYRAPSIKTILNIQTTATDTTAIYQEATLVMNELILLRQALSIDTNALSINPTPKLLEKEVRTMVRSQLQQWSINAAGSPRIRIIQPKGILLRISTAGVYLPWVMEGHIDGGLSTIQWPFTMAHEMGHAFGVTDEGECNFIAVLACIRSEDKFVKYSGLLSYWRYLANDLRYRAPTLFMQLVNQRSISIKNDIVDIYKHLDSYPDILPQLRDLVYDNYLKANGVHAGLASYNELVSMMMIYKTNREVQIY